MASTVYVLNTDPKNRVVTYNDGGDPAKKAALEALWKKFDRPDASTGQTLNILYRSTARPMGVQVDYFMPPNTPAGRYRVEVFVPGKHATTRRALFTVANNFRTQNGQPAYDDSIVMVNMYDLFDNWHPLGVYDLDPKVNPLVGRVRLMDLSIEEPPQEIAFGPVRWVPVPVFSGDRPRFDSPVGTQADRDGPFAEKSPAWVGKWFDYNLFLNWYFLGYHTGADLNMSGGGDADKNAPLYAIGDGIVTYAGVGTGSWGKIIVIEHPDGLVTLPNGTQQRQPVYSRYGHVSDQMLVKTGDAISRGANIGFVGLGAGQTTGWHLHFDISYTDVLKKRPSAWPDMTKYKQLKAEGKTNTKEYKDALAAMFNDVVKHYIDPLKFLKDNH
jgi:murein DD-endopeptidase MepM/ murein hydrolase activator NlpD